MSRQQTQNMLAAGASLLIVLALTLPWWTADIDIQGDGGFFGGIDSQGSESSGPFDDDLIEGHQAGTAGALLLVALLAGIAGTLVLSSRDADDSMRTIGRAMFPTAAFLILLAVILAVTTWPGEDMSFWDQQSSSRGGVNSEVVTYANAGWYLAVAAVATLVALTILVYDRGAETPADGSKGGAPRKCQGVTKAGTPCTRAAKEGGFCTTHS